MLTPATTDAFRARASIAGAPPAPDARRQPRRLALAAALLWLLLLSWLHPPAATAQGIELRSFEIQRTDEGVLLSFAAAFDLPRNVEEALLKGVPLYFHAEAAVFQERWYWRDRRVAQASRGWRLTYQPLTRRFRVGFGGLNQGYDTLADALGSLSRSSRWKIAEPGQIDEDARHYVEFAFRLDTAQLPRPMQIGIGGQPEWSLSIERRQRFGN